MKLDINGTVRDLDAPADMPLLWVIRDLGGARGDEVRLRHGPVRRLYRASRRATRSFVRAARLGRRRAQDHDDRRHLGRRLPSGAARVDRSGRRAVRILPIRADHDRRRAPGKKSLIGDTDIDGAMSGNVCRCGTYNRVREAIHLAARLKRGGYEAGARKAGVAARLRSRRERVARGLVLSFYVPENVAGAAKHVAQTPLAPANAFLRIAPDDAVIVVLAHSEMGQGDLDDARDAHRRGARLRLVQGAVGARTVLAVYNRVASDPR